MRRAVWLVMLLMPLWAVLFVTSITRAAEGPDKLDATPRVLDQFKFDLRHAFPAMSVKLEGDGIVRLVIPKEDYARATAQGQVLSEGYYLAIAGANFGAPRIEGASLLRMQITDVAEEGKVRAEIGQATAAKLKRHLFVLLFRPLDVTTARLKAVTAITPLEEGLPPASAAPADPRAFQEAHLAKSLVNLRQIGLAMHNFHSAYGSFPPALVRGPDGTPWHSWREILLPFLEQQNLYEQYRFDEAWDGPNNKLLIEKMPDVYSDPIHGENKDHFTHYAAITGEGTAFTAEGLKFDGRKPVLGKDTRISAIADGLSNTLLVGSISPAEKVPWTKPQDLVLADDFPVPGDKGGFALPYKLPVGNCGAFLVADGSVQLLARRRTWPSSARC
ncbi:MAG: DUF1559 domain-containing protein [Pirellulales bacterium]|nr:DUF1559 domain-containing protein [Pirellulales bacterium]